MEEWFSESFRVKLFFSTVDSGQRQHTTCTLPHTWLRLMLLIVRGGLMDGRC